ncbi:sirohydrochlorin chelatase [Arthrobacter sp. NamB2]|uniref:sirohydrochlorin chelatase n=1 Tax=Arthrobacter sp. NamB2 TaxID=2576035 RepID=UPI0010C99D2A|nr:CbiX/SirB N-terminal domain-containing protein [Arthrobacter sp. NamB2]TKV29515.1 sirohydrochlorin chelatase [Arthrobacter sp. NamB2]
MAGMTVENPDRGGAPVLIACAHGTDNLQGRREIDAVRAGIAALRPHLEVLEAYVDVQDPDLVDVVASLPPGRPAVIVPLLLSVGYHVKVDIARAAASRPQTVAALPLGPDPRLAHVLQRRLAEVGVDDGDAVVLAAAGSSDACAAEDVAEIRAVLAELRTGPVRRGFGSKATPSVPDAVTDVRGTAGFRVALASYLLAPGYFHDQLAKAGADAVSAPLLPSPVVAEIALARYDDAAVHLADGPRREGAPCPRPCSALVSMCVRSGSVQPA